jgi:flagellar protein FlaG
MQINAAALAGATVRPEPTSPGKVEEKARQSTPAPPPEEKKIQPEELLNKIKSLTQDGLYSVRFEMNKEVDELVIKVVSKEDGELVRQIPAEELLSALKGLRDYRGLILQTES